MWREGKTILGRGDNILGTWEEFSMEGLREPRTPTEHWMVLELLCGDRAMMHREYLKGRTTWPIREEKGTTQKIGGDLHFRNMKRKIKKPSSKEISSSAPWISDITWKIADQRTTLERKSRTNQGEHRVLTLWFQSALKEDIRSRVSRAREEIEKLLPNNKVIEAWSKTQQL